MTREEREREREGASRRRGHSEGMKASGKGDDFEALTSDVTVR